MYFSDLWRINQVEKCTADQDHDFSKFGTGNKETLDITPKVNITSILYLLGSNLSGTLLIDNKILR